MTTLVAQYTWNPKVNQYVDSRGRFVARTDVKAALEDVIDAARSDIRAASVELQEGRIEVGDWFFRMAPAIKTINVASAALAVGGTHGLTASVLGSTGVRIKDQYQYLRDFARELENGLPLDGSFLNRAGLYADSGRPTYEAMLRRLDIDAGFVFERRNLGRSEHCDQCVYEASLGWQPSGVLLPIGECTCLNLCHCTFSRSRTNPDAEPAKGKKGAKAMSLLDAIASRPWAITEEGLRTIVAVASRDNLDPQALAAKLGRPLDNTHTVTIRDGVASIPITGPIFRHANLLTEVSGATSTANIATDFRAALDNHQVSAIVLDIDSPGGEAFGIGELAGMIHSARGVKPIVAYVSGAGCSAAYWIASAADEVVISPSSIVGSIGAIFSFERRGDGEKEPVVIKSVQSPDKYHDPESVKGQSKFQAIADAIASVFIEDVARNRGVGADDVMLRYGRGGVMVGRAAVAAGMADGIGSLESVISCLSSGQMPCPPTKPPRKGGKPTKEPAMSEHANPPVAGDTATISASELAELRKLAGQAGAHEAAAKASLDEAINARADSFVAEFAGPANKTMYALALRSNFVQAAMDDHANPLAGSRTARQDGLREMTKSRPAATKEVISSDPSEETRALESDPAKGPKAEEDEELQRIDADTRKFAAGLNGKRK